jgi:deoxyribodipyrimidine photo-lyase
LKTIKNGEFINYDNERNDLKKETTHLSAYIKFGCVSIREVYYKILLKLGKSNGLINELIWRDFYMNITYYYPKILQGQISIKKKNQPLKDKYKIIKWSKNNKFYKKWCNGETGFPIVDAAMTQLNTTGYMHNRCRMIVACFLCKDLLLDWRLGEKYFATKLVDYDPMSNSGGWQWSSSVGADSQPYFRIFNPWAQQIKFDPECKYIKKWLPILSECPVNHIHKWYEYHNNYDVYCKPIVDHDIMRKKALDLYL